VTHSDLASLSVAHERDPKDEEVLARYHQALCRIFGHLPYTGFSVVKITEDGKTGSYCGGHLRGCPCCARCNQVSCEHAEYWAPRPVSTNTCWTKPGEGLLVSKDEDYEW
jgi:hypothetical protein